MTFDDLDVKLRVYETAHDYCVVPGLYMIARIDGRNFTRSPAKIDWGKTQLRKSKLKGLFSAIRYFFCWYNSQ